MNTYKLIKKYPGLPEDWEIGMIVETGDIQGLACFSPCNGKYTDKYIDHNDVIKNPEFWEKVIKYPVGTKIKNKYSLAEYIKTENGWLYNPVLTNITHEINESEIGEGKRFELVENYKKLISVSFTTVDGVDIREGDKFWYTNKSCDNLWNSKGNQWFKNKEFVCFSTEEAAKEYILWNKPYYSLSQISKNLNIDIKILKNKFL